MNIKRTLCGLLAAGLLVTAFTGCQDGGTGSTPGGATDGTSSTVENEKPYEGETINFVTVMGRSGDYAKEHLQDFKDLTGITVEMEQVTNEQLPQKLAVLFAAGGKDIDLVQYAPLQNLLLYTQNGWLEPLDDYVSDSPEMDIDDFSAETVEINKVDEKLYGIPIMTEREVVMYNKAMFEEAGITEIPTTFDELEDAAAALNSDSVAGITMRGKGSQAVTQFAGFLYGYGGDWMDENKNATINTPEAIEAFDMYGRLLREYGPVGSVNMGAEDTANVFAQGMAAMRVDADSQFAYAADPDSSLVADDVSVFQLPAGPAGSKPYNIVPWALGISSGSEHKGATWEFIKWWTSKDIDVEMLKWGNPSPRNSSWENEEAASEAFQEDLVKVINETNKVGIGYDRPVMINVGDARTEIGNVIIASIEGQDIKTAADKANEAMQEMLDSEK